MVIQISLPGAVSYDRRTKEDAFTAAGVTEYWIVDPNAQTIEVLLLMDATYSTQVVFRGQALLSSKIVPVLPARVAQFSLEDHRSQY